MTIPLHLQIAMGELGVEEWKGRKHNPRILEYIDSTPAGIWSQTDELAWCGAFGAWCVWHGPPPWLVCPDDWKPHRAREWLRLPNPTDSPQLGDVCVLQLRNGRRSRRARNRTGSARGGWHVGFFMDKSRSGVIMVSGNTQNKVGVDFFSHRRWAVMGYRQL